MEQFLGMLGDYVVISHKSESGNKKQKVENISNKIKTEVLNNNNSATKLMLKIVDEIMEKSRSGTNEPRDMFTDKEIVDDALKIKLVYDKKTNKRFSDIIRSANPHIDYDNDTSDLYPLDETLKGVIIPDISRSSSRSSTRSLTRSSTSRSRSSSRGRSRSSSRGRSRSSSRGRSRSSSRGRSRSSSISRSRRKKRLSKKRKLSKRK